MTDEAFKLVRLEEEKLFSPEEGLLRQVLAYNDRLMLVRHLMQPRWSGARHSHPHDQMVYVVSGHLRFTAGGRSFEVRAGDSFVVPGGMEHQAEALEKSEVLDVFAPVRQDYTPGAYPPFLTLIDFSGSCVSSRGRSAMICVRYGL